MLIRFLFFSPMVLLCFQSARAGENDWHQWLGPNRNAIAADANAPKPWDASGPELLWRKPLGEGVSSISISKNRAVTMFGKGDEEFVVCLDANTGKEYWRVYSGRNFQERHANGPRSTPTIHGDRVYALSAGGMLYALDLETGAAVWKVHLKKTFESTGPSDEGYATAPLVDGNRLLVEVGGNAGKSLVAFNKNNGKVLWSTESVKSGFSSPIVTELKGRRQAIFFSGSGLISVSPETGETWWKHPWTTEYDVNAVTPIVIDQDKIFISSAYGVGSALLYMRPKGKGLEINEIWSNKHFKNHYATSILYDDYLYGYDNSTLTCIDVEKGERQWRSRDIPKGSLLGVGGRLLVLTEKGELYLADPSPKGVTVLAKAKVIEPNCYTVPALSNGRLFIRNLEEIAVFKLDM